MLGIIKTAKGRMGNRLFHYHFLRQIAQKTGIDYFHPNLPDSKYFLEMEKKPKPFLLFKKKTILTSREVLNFKPEEFIEFIKNEDKQSKDVVFNPPMLGEVFFDYLFYPPIDFIKIKDEFKINFDFDVSNKKVVGLHFRGTDFKAWNENASLKFEYYQSAIDFCFQELKEDKLVFVIFTDDLNFDTFVKTVDYLKSINAEYYVSDNKRAAIYDFYQMSQCDILVSSPSTFAIFAGILGKNKKIIHAQGWLDYAVGRNDAFWVKLSDTKNSFYSLWKTF